jgi:hypothetical protein
MPFFVWQPKNLATWIRISIMLVCCGVFLYWTVFHLLPDRDAQALRVDLVRVVHGVEPMNSGMLGISSGLTMEDVTLLNKLGLRGSLHKGPTIFMGGGPVEKARALIVVTEPLENPVILRQPKATNVVYVQGNGTWTMIPSDAPTLRQKIRLSPVHGDTTKIRVILDQESGDGDIFTWRPAMTTR